MNLTPITFKKRSQDFTYQQQLLKMKTLTNRICSIGLTQRLCNKACWYIQNVYIRSICQEHGIIWLLSDSFFLICKLDILLNVDLKDHDKIGLGIRAASKCSKVSQNGKKRGTLTKCNPVVLPQHENWDTWYCLQRKLILFSKQYLWNCCWGKSKKENKGSLDS